MAKRQTATPANAAAKPKASATRQPTCFVVIGFGRKTDFATGRVLDLDATYEQLIRPAFDNVGVNCFRAIDANLTGSIDSIMYQWIYEADFVIADLSTLNANVFYELGVRHAQKPNTTLIIAESVLMTKIPFDLSSFVLHQYVHGGDKIAEEEQERFVGYLSTILQGIIDVEKNRLAEAADSARENDSPVFTFLPGMTPPEYSFDKHLAPPVYIPPEERAQQSADVGESLASIIQAAEAAKNSREFDRAIELFQTAIERDNGKPDIFLAQRLALVTYKAGEKKDADGELEKNPAINGLLDAEEILKRYCAPKISTDPETLGLSGAINKRLFDLTEDTEYLDRAIYFYERGFYVKQDYYNGINVAFMYTLKANLLEEPFDAIVHYGHANLIRKKVAEIVQELIDDEETFGKMPNNEKQWIYMTQAEAYQGMGMEQEAQRLEGQIAKVADDFGRDSFDGQQKKLRQAMDEFESRNLSSAAPTAAAPRAAAPRAAAPAPSHQTASPAVLGSRTVTIDADIVKDKPIKSVEVSCKIEYVDG